MNCRQMSAAALRLDATNLMSIVHIDGYSGAVNTWFEVVLEFGNLSRT